MERKPAVCQLATEIQGPNTRISGGKGQLESTVSGEESRDRTSCLIFITRQESNNVLVEN